MLNYNNLTPADLVEILNQRGTRVITVDIITANNIGFPIGERNNFSIPVLTDSEIGQVQAITMLLDIDDKKSLWNSFILLAANAGTEIFYTNINDVDCRVELIFN